MKCKECQNLDEHHWTVRDYVMSVLHRCVALNKWCPEDIELEECKEYIPREAPWPGEDE